MIEDKIAEAKRAKQLLLLKTLLLVSLLALMSLGFLWWFSMPKLPPEPAAQTTQQNEKNAEQPIAERAESGYRQAYLDAYALYENDLKPALGDIDLQRWKSDLARQITDTEALALKRFSEADYVGASNQMDALVRLAEQSLEDSQNQFDQAMNDAQQAFDDNEIDAARSAIETALMLRKNSAAAADLAERIGYLPEIVTLTENIRVAEVEGNRQKALTFIRQLRELTPERTALRDRQVVLESELKQQQYQAHVARAYQRIDEGKPVEADAERQRAAALYPNRPEIDTLKNAIEQLAREQRVSALQQRVQAAVAADNWQDVKSYVEQMLKETPDDAVASQILADATAIVSLNQQLDSLSASPYRLVNDNVHNAARTALNQSEQYSADSSSLAQKAQALEALLTAVNTPVSVEIRSDNQTHISVRGVGNVGQVQSRVIELKPGQYTFEGRRAGYKSTLKEVLVPYDRRQISLTLVCDEPV